MKKRCTVKIHPAGLALFGAAFLFADSHFVLAAISALLLHEAAHVLAMQLCGMHGCMVEITPFGGMIDAKKFETFPPYKQALVSAAGVAASAAMTFLCMRFLPHTL